MATAAGKGWRARKLQVDRYRRNFRKIFGKPKARPGRTRYIATKDGLVEGVAKEADSVDLHSLTLACAPEQQAEMEQHYRDNGVHGVKHHPETGEAIFPNRQTQLAAAKSRGFEVD